MLPTRSFRTTFLLLLGLQCVDVAAAAAQTSTIPHGLRLRPGDAVRLLVTDEPLLTGEYAVLEDGQVLLPLVGLVPVAGVEFEDALRAVRAAYSTELLATVVVQPLVRVRVLGEVNVPGLYLVDATYGIADVVARAGGLRPGSAQRHAVLVRDGQRRRVELGDPSSLAGGGLYSGDEVLVPRRGWLGEHSPVLVGAAASVLAAALTALIVR